MWLSVNLITFNDIPGLSRYWLQREGRACDIANDMH